MFYQRTHILENVGVARGGGGITQGLKAIVTKTNNIDGTIEIAAECKSGRERLGKTSGTLFPSVKCWREQEKIEKVRM